MIIAFLAVLLLASGCTNPFNNKVSNKDTNSSENKLLIGEQTFSFEVAQPINDSLKDKFLLVVSKRLKGYNYNVIHSEFVADNKFILSFKIPENVIFSLEDFTKYMSNTPTFEIRLREDPENLVLTDEENKGLQDYNATALKKAEDILSQLQENPEKFVELAKENSEDPGSKDNGGAYKGIKKGQFVPEYDQIIFGDLAVGKIYPKVVETSFGYHIIKKDAETGDGDARLIDTSHILIMKKTAQNILAKRQWKETGLVGMYINTAEAFQPQEGKYAVGISLDEDGTKILKEFTTNNMGGQMAVFVDGVGIAAPKIDQVIENGKIIITGDFTETGANNLANRLNNGVLNMPIRILAE